MRNLGQEDPRRGGYPERGSHVYRNDEKRGFRADSRRGDGYARGRDGYSRDRSGYPDRGGRGYRGSSRRDDGYASYANDHGRYSNAESRSRYVDTSAKGDYGPKLARELDSTYDEKMNRNYANSIFIGNLTYNTTPEDLKEYFGKIGEVRRADIITSRGHHRGMGTVEFTRTGDVDRAIKECDGAYLNERVIFVRQDNPPPSETRKRDRNGPPPPPKRSHDDGYEIFVAQLPFNVNWQELKDMFKSCGDVLHADVVMDRDGKSRGFGTVYMATRDEQTEAIKRWNGVDYKGRQLDVKIGKGSSVHTPPSGADTYIPQRPHNEASVENANVYDLNPLTTVGGGEKSEVIFCENMPSSTTESDLYDLFGSVAPVVKAQLQLNEEGHFTNNSICQFETVDDAEVCINKLDNYSYGDHELKVSFAKF